MFLGRLLLSMGGGWGGKGGGGVCTGLIGEGRSVWVRIYDKNIPLDFYSSSYQNVTVYKNILTASNHGRGHGCQL